MRLPCGLGLRQRLFVLLQNFIGLIGESSFYCTIPSILPVLLNRCCWISTGPPTRREQNWDTGIAKRWKESGRAGMAQKWEWGNGEIIYFSGHDFDCRNPSLSEEALGEGRNKADLDQQTQPYFHGSQSNKGIS